MSTEIKNIQNLSEKEYRAYPVESFSSIKHLLESPDIFKHFKEKPFKGSSATLLGTCIHHYLQGNSRLVGFQELPLIKKNTEANVKFEKDFLEFVGEEGIIVPKAFEEKLKTIEKNFHTNKQAVKLLSVCEMEKAYLFDINGVQLKGKIDGVTSDYIVEIKSSSQATNLQEFRAEAIERNYDLQAYMYTVAAKVLHHYFIVVNTVDPYKVAIYRSSYDFIAGGHAKAMIVTNRYRNHILNGEEWDDNIIEEV